MCKTTLSQPSFHALAHTTTATSSDESATATSPDESITTTKASPTSTVQEAAPPPKTTSKPAKASTTPDNGIGVGVGVGLGGALANFFPGINRGDGTYYDTGLGACGITNSNSDLIVAVSHQLFDAVPGYDGVNPNHNPICNKQMKVSFQGKSVTVTVTDRCGGCQSQDVDLSPSAFNAIADPALGRIDVQWAWV